MLGFKGCGCGGSLCSKYSITGLLSLRVNWLMSMFRTYLDSVEDAAPRLRNDFLGLLFEKDDDAFFDRSGGGLSFEVSI